MDVELTTDQARLIARLRAQWPGSELRVHQRPWGVIVEVRRSGHTVQLIALDARGGVRADRRLGRAA
jgi:hypothetical protein